ncbi:protein O-GlcNAcase-like [Micropterus salmoides]|uniref:protein O-GlcNAcase-like n=1 Tax=Micropterus salmoides TaxID=27706 RepID=UPI0018EBD115|nr:protein O-GlcNAcase-like [Micropterus salmoides]
MEERKQFLCGVVEGQLRTLIAEAQLRGLKFVYALSPGQDIVFSSSCDLTLLKRKLRQVSDLGWLGFTSFHFRPTARPFLHSPMLRSL